MPPKDGVCPHLATQKYTKGTQGGNGRTFGGWNNLAKIRFNTYVDIIEESNKNTEKEKVHTKALLKKACVELNISKAAKRNGNKKRKSGVWKRIPSHFDTHLHMTTYVHIL